MAINKATTISSHESIKAKIAPAQIPGLIEGRTTRCNVVPIDAPRLHEACSSLGSKFASEAETVINTIGAASIAWAMIIPE